MKKVITFIGIFGFSGIAMAQYNTTWYTPSTANTSAAGYIGIGTKSTTTSTNTPLPAYNLHLHGTTDYIQNDPPVSGMDQGGHGTQAQTKIAINLGKTTRLGMTNTVTGNTEWDGTVLRASGNDFFITNQEAAGNTMIMANGIGMNFSGSTQRIWVGGAGTTSTNYARFNVASQDNGLYIETMASTSKYGIRVKMQLNTSDAIQVFQNDGTTKNFRVTGGGEVYARKYTTTLAAIPDYVFQPDYQLMPLSELRTYVNTNSHLPNVPSAKEFEANGVDLGELNRLLLEKTEELTLYILQLEDRIKSLEETTK
jgi:hypothetical protein